MIGIVNMQTNNINCFIKLLKRFKYEYKIINSFDDYNESISKLIIPGIGNYAHCIEYIINNKLDKVIYKHNNDNKKMLGICIGMQILTSWGDEGAKTNGLDIIPNSYTTLINTDEILPHVGWNSLEIKNKDDLLFNDINLINDFYFVHSYNVICDNNNLILATTKYGKSIINAIIKKDNIIAIQFHPEKSGLNGIKFIENFLKY